MVTSLLFHQYLGLHILWWLSWRTPLTIQGLVLTLEDFAQGVCRHLCGPIFRVLIYQSLRPISFHNLIKLLSVRCIPKNSIYSALHNTTLILGWGAASINQYSLCMCWFLIPITVNRNTFMFKSRNGKFPFELVFSRVKCKFGWTVLAASRPQLGTPLTVLTMSSTYLKNNFTCWTSFSLFLARQQLSQYHSLSVIGAYKSMNSIPHFRRY